MAWATPGSIRKVVGAVRNKYPDLQLSLHLHDTRGMGIANAYAGMEMGVLMTAALFHDTSKALYGVITYA
jgi:isopropylmalate/homocitrate/citramalate synthase